MAEEQDPKLLDATAEESAAENGERKLPQTKMPGEYSGETFTRRSMFSGGAIAAGGIAGAAIILPSIGFALGPVFKEQEFPWQDVGGPEDFTPDTYIPKTMTLISGIGEAGKTTVYVRKGNPEVFSSEKVGEIIALSTRCMHLGCPVRYVTASQSFVCPCHGGTYDFQGKVTGGPPVRPLDRFNTRIRNGKVEIGSRYSVNDQLKRFSYRDPGEPLNGLWEYLYPRRFSVPPPQG